MKNLFLALVATVLIGGSSFGQAKMTKEEARQKAADVMITFVLAVEPIYQESKPASYNAFLAALYPTTKPALTVEANALLSDAYQYLITKASASDIKKNYNGVSLARAAASVSNTSKGTVNLDEIFGGTNGDFNPYEGQQRGRCKWWQLSCHLDSIFGDGMGEVILNLLIDLLR